jgi:hypothetical protein
MSEYTRGDDRLHMAYSFAFLGDDFGRTSSAAGSRPSSRARRTAGRAWSFSNHDVVRPVTRWHRHGEGDADTSPASSPLLLLAFEGSVCLYQGEELGLPETDLLFEELTDPPGIRFWPDYKGRDGCRTPMPWTPHGPACGFSEGKPWLPVKAPHRALTVADQEADPASTLAFVRAMIAWRRATPALRHGRSRFPRPARRRALPGRPPRRPQPQARAERLRLPRAEPRRRQVAPRFRRRHGAAQEGEDGLSGTMPQTRRRPIHAHEMRIECISMCIGRAWPDLPASPPCPPLRPAVAEGSARVWCSGSAPASQAGSAGSIPATRSSA